MSTYEEDLRIIEAATPGPWQLDGKRGLDALVSCLQSTIYVNGNEMDATFIAHFNPTKCRELVEENQQLRGGRGD